MSLSINTKIILLAVLISLLASSVSAHWKNKVGKLNDNTMRSECPHGTRLVIVPGTVVPRCEPVFRTTGSVTPFRLSNVVPSPFGVFRQNPVVSHGLKGVNKPFSVIKTVKSALHSAMASKFAKHTGSTKHGHKSKF